MTTYEGQKAIAKLKELKGNLSDFQKRLSEIDKNEKTYQSRADSAKKAVDHWKKMLKKDHALQYIIARAIAQKNYVANEKKVES